MTRNWLLRKRAYGPTTRLCGFVIDGRENYEEPTMLSIPINKTNFSKSFLNGNGALAIKSDNDAAALSNHAWGTAFDINAKWNPFTHIPALVGSTGSVRELVKIANDFGFYWGGHFQQRY